MRNADLTYKDIFEEIPVRIKNNLLTTLFLQQVQASKQLTTDFENLDLASNLYLERNTEFLVGNVEELNFDFSQYKNYFVEEQRKKAQKEEAQKKVIPN